MSKYNIKDEVGKNFIKVKALAFFRNFIRNHDSTIFNEDFFEVFIDETFYETTSFEDSVAVTVRKKIIQILKSELDAALLKKIVKFSIDNKENAKRFLLYAWNLCDNRDTIRNKLLEVSGESLERCDIFNKDKEVFELRLEELCRIMKLSGIESDILLLSFLFREYFLDTPDKDLRRGRNSAEFVECVGKYLDYPVMELTRLMNAQGKLRRYDCLDKELRLNDSVLEFLYGFNTEPFSDNYFKQFKNETLPWAFYGKLAETHGKILKRIINDNRGARSINILLYGEPGTGKTSFAQSLAAELKLTCYSISQSPGDDDDGLSSCPELRFGALQICDGQIDSQSSIIVIDESDEMLRGGSGGNFTFSGGKGMRMSGDKGMLNAVLDTLKTPCIWIANIPAESLDASSRRRFDYSIRFDKLNSEQRLAIWRNAVKKFKLGRSVHPSLQEKFATKYEVSAGGISLVLQNIAGLKLKKSEVESMMEELITPHCELMNIPTDNKNLMMAPDYSLDGLNIKGQIPLHKIEAAICRFQREQLSVIAAGVDRPRMNLLLSGPPGTGKTEFVKYLGKTLNTKILVKAGSDLLDQYVGGTEQNICEAFRQAEKDKAILFLDEVDGLLRSRQIAARSWEVTQVNELLQQMENFNGILVCATNFADNLDPATIRRFTFKLEFDYLDNTGKKLFFERMFKTGLNCSELKRLENIVNLAPGDFRIARQGFYYLDSGNISAGELLEALEQESLAKKRIGKSANTIGFN